jgi:hypothetical protein
MEITLEISPHWLKECRLKEADSLGKLWATNKIKFY